MSIVSSLHVSETLRHAGYAMTLPLIAARVRFVYHELPEGCGAAEAVLQVAFGAFSGFLLAMLILVWVNVVLVLGEYCYENWNQLEMKYLVGEPTYKEPLVFIAKFVWASVGGALLVIGFCWIARFIVDLV
jgi:hypothetical protein